MNHNPEHPTYQALLNNQPVSDEQVQAYMDDIELELDEELDSAMGALEAPLVDEIDGEVCTTSMRVAAHFGKLHKDVLRAIRNLECSAVFRERNFAPTFQSVPGPNGAVRTEPAYRMTRDGFSFLCMGFTGAEAAHWKEKFIEAFNLMERELLAREAAPAAPAPQAASVLQTLLGALLPLLLPLLPALLAAVTAWLNRQANPSSPKLPEYMAEPWFLILQAVCMEHPRVDVARSLGVSAPFLSQVLNGSGKYGRGEASTHKLAGRVIHKFANVHQHRLPPAQQHRPRKTTVTVEQH